jgi:hypothetical protein
LYGYDVQWIPEAGSNLCAIAIHANLILQLFEPIEEAEGVIQLQNEQVKIHAMASPLQGRPITSLRSSKGSRF